MTAKKLRLVVSRKGRTLDSLHVTADPDDDKTIRGHLLELIREHRGDTWRQLPDYSVEVFVEGERYTPLRTVRFEAKR